jgi:peptide/nickel transport system substrate-binding protein
MEIGIHARPPYYSGPGDPVVVALMNGLAPMTDTDDRNAVLQAVQARVAEQATNVFLFQLAKTGVADARIEGLWENMPTQANDMTAVYWRD